MWIFWLLVGSTCSVWIVPWCRMGGGNVPMTPNYHLQAPSQVHFCVKFHATACLCCALMSMSEHVCVCVYFGSCVCWVEVSACQLSLRLWAVVNWLFWWGKFEVFFSPGLVLWRSVCVCYSLLGQCVSLQHYTILAFLVWRYARCSTFWNRFLRLHVSELGDTFTHWHTVHMSFVR